MSLGGSQIVAGSLTIFFPTGSANGILTAAGQTFTPLGRYSILVDGSTLLAKGSASIISGTTLSVDSSGLVIGSQTFAFPTPAPGFVPSASIVITFAGQIFTPLENAAVAFGGTTLVANGPAVTVFGTVLSLASSDVVVGTQTFAFPTSTPMARQNGVVIVDGTILTAGSPAVTISGSTLSLAVGSSGFYLSGHGSGSSTFSVKVTPGISISLNAAGWLAVSVSNGVGGLGLLIMPGFGTTDTKFTASAAGNGAGTTPGNAFKITASLFDFIWRRKQVLQSPYHGCWTYLL